MSWYDLLFKKKEPKKEMTIEDAVKSLVTQVEEEAPCNYFSEKELKCSCGCNAIDMEEKFLTMLNRARQIDGKPWKINSAYRCSKHNASVGGKKTSAHLHGCAVDISAPTSARKFAIVSAAMQAGFNRIGVGSNFVHLDSDTSAGHPANVLWTY